MHRSTKPFSGSPAALGKIGRRALAWWPMRVRNCTPFSSSPRGKTMRHGVFLHSASRSSNSASVSRACRGKISMFGASYVALTATMRLTKSMSVSGAASGAISASGADRCASSLRMKASADSLLTFGTISCWHAFCADIRASFSISFSASTRGSGLPFPGRLGVGARYSPAAATILRIWSGPSERFSGRPPVIAALMTVSASGKSAP